MLYLLVTVLFFLVCFIFINNFLSPVFEILNNMFGSETVQKGGEIVSLQRSNWVSDEYSKGSHTYPKVGK